MKSNQLFPVVMPKELKAVFPSLDNFKYRNKGWLLDVGGNNLGLMAFVVEAEELPSDVALLRTLMSQYKLRERSA